MNEADAAKVNFYRAACAGFGLALPMLDTRAPAKYPWLTSAVVAQENAVDEYEHDVVRVFLDSTAEHVPPVTSYNTALADEVRRTFTPDAGWS